MHKLENLKGKEEHMLKTSLVLILLLSSVSYGQDNMFIFHTSFFAGCMKTKYIQNGKSNGKNTKYCKKESSSRKFGFIPYEQEDKIIEKSAKLYFKGCRVDGKLSIDSCLMHALLYENELKEIIKQKPKTK